MHAIAVRCNFLIAAMCALQWTWMMLHCSLLWLNASPSAALLADCQCCECISVNLIQSRALPHISPQSTPCHRCVIGFHKGPRLCADAEHAEHVVITIGVTERLQQLCSRILCHVGLLYVYSATNESLSFAMLPAMSFFVSVCVCEVKCLATCFFLRQLAAQQCLCYVRGPRVASTPLINSPSLYAHYHHHHRTLNQSTTL